MCRLKTDTYKHRLCTRSSPFTNWGNTAALGIPLIHIWWFQVPGHGMTGCRKKFDGKHQDGGWSGYPVLTIAIKKKALSMVFKVPILCKKFISLQKWNFSLVCSWIPEKGEKSILQWFCLLLFSKMFPHRWNSQNQPSDVTDTSQISGCKQQASNAGD